MILTKTELIGIISEQAGLTKQASDEVLEVILDVITKSLKSGRDVRLRKFGRFHTVERRRRRVGGSDVCGDLPLSPMRAVRFRCSKFLKACVNDGGPECCLWPAELERIYDNLVSADRFRTILEGHGLWLASKGGKGKRAELAGCNLQGADLEEFDQRKIKLSDACLAKADLSGANLENADLENANLEAACLASACLTSACLKRANLKGASLAWADLKEADLQEADLSDADLLYADLSGAQLKGARFTNCRFFRTNLKNTLLERKSSNPWGSLKNRLRSALNPKPVVPCPAPKKK